MSKEVVKPEEKLVSKMLVNNNGVMQIKFLLHFIIVKGKDN